MFRVLVDEEIRLQVAALPSEALAGFAEALVFLELTPLAGSLWNPDGRGNFRTVTFGPGGAGLIVYFVLEEHRETALVSIVWVS